MRFSFTFSFILAFLSGFAQHDSMMVVKEVKYPPYQKKTITLTCAVGFIDAYKHDLKLPKDFENNNTSGFAPVYIKAEYALAKHTSLGASFAYDAFNDNYDQIYTGNGETYKRFRTDNIRIISGSLIGYYHFDKYIKVKNLDLFAGFGLTLSNIRHGSAPQVDSTTAIVMDHTVTLYLKAGARYYLTNRTSLYADLGYDRQSVMSLGFSYRFRRQRLIPNVAVADTPK